MIAGSITLVVRRRESLRTEARLDSLVSREAVFLLQNLVLVAMAAVIFWVTFFPLISEAITGNQVSVGPPAFRPFVIPLALIVVLLSGIGPIIAWRRVTLSKLRRSFAFPLSAAVVALVVLLAVAGAAAHGFALAMFVFGTFVLASVAQEFFRGIRARRAMTREAPPVALVALVRRNRRRYGGYIVHAGVAVALIGVAASTSFAHSRYANLRPGQSAQIDGYTLKYLRPTAGTSAQKITFGAVLDVSKGGHHVTTLHTSYGLYPSQDGSLGPVGRFFGGSAETRIGLDAGLTRDIWTVVDPSIQPLQPLINEGNRKFFAAMTSLANQPAASRNASLNQLFALRDVLIGELTNRFVSHPWTVKFLIIISPLVTWLWLGAIISIIGGLIALAPVPARARRRTRTAVAPPAAGTPLPAARELV
jgi:cytochrome c-type biogenesis protein CcmF